MTAPVAILLFVLGILSPHSLFAEKPVCGPEGLCACLLKEVSIPQRSLRRLANRVMQAQEMPEPEDFKRFKEIFDRFLVENKVETQETQIPYVGTTPPMTKRILPGETTPLNRYARFLESIYGAWLVARPDRNAETGEEAYVIFDGQRPIMGLSLQAIADLGPDHRAIHEEVHVATLAEQLQNGHAIYGARIGSISTPADELFAYPRQLNSLLAALKSASTPMSQRHYLDLFKRKFENAKTFAKFLVEDTERLLDSDIEFVLRPIDSLIKAVELVGFIKSPHGKIPAFRNRYFGESAKALEKEFHSAGKNPHLGVREDLERIHRASEMRLKLMRRFQAQITLLSVTGEGPNRLSSAQRLINALLTSPDAPVLPEFLF